MQIREALKMGVGVLSGVTETARLDAEVLLAHCLKKPVTFLLAHDDSRMPIFAQWKYERLIAKRRQGIPVAYLTGHKEFYFLDFFVTPDVLIPRPDTEILVDSVVEYLNSKLEIRNSKQNQISNFQNLNIISDFGFRISDFLLLDVGTGSGCILISVLKNICGLEAIATDISGRALKIAKKNARRHGVADRIWFIKSDLLDSVSDGLLNGREITVTANLPYVPEGHPVTPSVAWEPRAAVYAGSDGMDIYQRFCAQVIRLRPRAIFLEALEHQIEVLRQVFSGYDSHTIKSLSGEVRFIVFERNNIIK